MKVLHKVLATCSVRALSVSVLIYVGIGHGAQAEEATEQTAAGAVALAGLAPDIAPAARPAPVAEVLGVRDVDRYRQIFELQEDGDWASADAMIAELRDPLLMGHILFQRYMHPDAYRSSYDELAAWLESYRDLPEAVRVYRLATSRAEDGDAELTVTFDEAAIAESESDDWAGRTLPTRDLTGAQRSRVRELTGQIAAHIDDGRPSAALRVLSGTGLDELLSMPEYDSWRARIARSYFAYGEDERALDLARAAAARSGEYVDLAGWTAGLAAWRLGKLEVSGLFFRKLAEAGSDDAFLSAGAAYWAARVYGVLKEPLVAHRMLDIATQYPRTLYGLLALRSLGRQPTYSWQEPSLTQAEIDQLSRLPGVRRALALVEVGRADLAESELRHLYPQVGEQRSRSLLILAQLLELPSMEVRYGNRVAGSDGRRHDAALFPVPSWHPASGFTVDRAVVYAVVRQESVFNERAVSPAGARGLMQLMPATATFIDGENDYRSAADQLFDPDLNLELGQRYIRHLLDYSMIDGNLLFTFAAYNAGPGNLQSWLGKVDHMDDPLLFIETIPVYETRIYVRRVLTNLWIYRHRLGQNPVTLDALAAGRWPSYVDLDTQPMFADNAGN